MKHGHYHFFSVADFPPSTEILATYDVFFLLVSVFIAISASLISFVLAAKMAQTELQNERAYWSLASACFLGFGIWSMHFVGMLAYQLPLVVSYDPFITLLSVFPAILASVVVMGKLPYKKNTLWLRSIYMGLGIGSMHYIGMMAMQMDAAMVYNGWYFSLSIVVAIGLAGIALKTHEYVTTAQLRITKQIVPAIIMGSAISGMHYTGMLSMHVYALPETRLLQEPETKNLVYLVMLMVTLFAFAILVFIELRTRTLLLERYNAVLNTVQDGVITFDNSGLLEFANPVASNMFGLGDLTTQSVHIRELISPCEHTTESLIVRLKKGANNSVAHSAPFTFDGMRKNGKVFPLSLKVNQLPGNHIAYMCTIKDLSDVKNQEVFAQTVFDALPNMLLVKNAQTLSITHVNDAGSELLGIDKASLIGLTDFDIFEEKEAKAFVTDDKQLLLSAKKQNAHDYRLYIGGRMRYLHTKKIVIDDSYGDAQFILSLSEDVTKWREAQYELKTLNRRMSMAADAARIGVWEWDIRANVLIWNEWMHNIYNITQNQFNGLFSDWEDSVHPNDVDSVKKKIEKAVLEKSSFEATYRIKALKEQYRHVKAYGRVEGSKMFGINVDITEQIEAEKKIKKHANSDTLTGLANRLALSTYMRNELPRLERNTKICTLFYLDLNRFKPLNDEYGHALGDEVLVELAQRLKALCRSYDIAARVGGDEFIVVVTELSKEYDTERIAMRLFKTLTQPITTAQGEFSVGVSIGHASYPSEGKTLEELIHIADERMYEDKKQHLRKIEKSK
ncbi:diguanylate cyclase domain-containing protein [Alteromonas sp. BL110]|uniref:diguanylate cyclase domain-containing protein n=1 Tax=Alteromonas sp. BL110 TaxID=1714845 RepID=UPI001E4A15A4|nr:diguanylate cyclase [Alteromonas sp. BL110]